MLNKPVFRFTSDDIFIHEASFKNQMYVSLQDIANNSIEETQRTDEIYEITVTSDMVMGISMVYFYSFKNSDNGVYIEAGRGTTIYEYDILYKITE